MQITAELAKRIEERTSRGRKPPMPEAKKMEILIDWLEGKNYGELAEKHKSNKTSIAKVIREAKVGASKVLKKEIK